MAREKSARKGGGKLARSKTVTVRLDPRLHYLAELAARKQRRTLSSFIEWAIQDALEEVLIFDPETGKKSSLADCAAKLWDIEEADRLVQLVVHSPDLLSFDEQRIWKVIEGTNDFWNRPGRAKINKLNMASLQLNWNSIVSYANKEISYRDYCKSLIS